MDKKKLMYIGGALLVAGAGLYLWNKSKRAKASSTSRLKSDESETSESTLPTSTKTESSLPAITPPASTQPASTDASNTTPAITPITNKKLSDFEVNALLLRECGKKPVLNIKNKIERYETCKNKFKDRLKSAGMISFDGGEYMGMATLKKGLPKRRPSTRPSRSPFDGESTDVFEPVASFDAFEPLI